MLPDKRAPTKWFKIFFNGYKESTRKIVEKVRRFECVASFMKVIQILTTNAIFSLSVRQGTLREYLPPINTQKPRPFEPVTPPNQNHNIGGGYPPAGSITPRPPFTEGYPSINPEITPPVQTPGFNGYPTPSQPQPPSTNYPSPTGPTGYPSNPTPSVGYPSPGPSTGYPSSSGGSTNYPTTGYPNTNYPSPKPTINYPSTGYPNPSTGYPSPSTNFPSPSPSYPSPSPSYPSPSPSPSYPSPSPSYPSPSPSYPSPSPNYPSTSYPSPSTNYPSPTTGYPSSSSGTGYPTGSPTTAYPTFTTSYPSFPTTTPGYPSSPAPTTYRPSTNPPYTSYPQSTTPAPEENTIPTKEPYPSTPADHSPTDTEITTVIAPPDEDLKHPPHIHAIDVECSKDMMTINIEFNRLFDGIIYSKGHYQNSECRYVKENSGRKKYTFTVSLNSCGTEFINAFDTQGKSYLENVLVLQNEPGIQEVWDTIRSVRCLWEGNLKKVLNVALSVGMLNQEIVTFSGDTAMARLDIQLGKGPFAPSANGLVKIGEVMTLVVSVTGDPGFDIQVKDCRAKDTTGQNVVYLTDEKGCILKPKLFGAFQKTRNTGNTGSSIIAYAFFNAFKFPDVMDLTLECNVDLCKTDCEVCPEPNQQLEPGRRRRRDLYSPYSYNATEDTSVRVGKIIRVILPEDLSDSDAQHFGFQQYDSVCISSQGFILSCTLLISLLALSCLFSAYTWLKYQRLSLKQ